MRQRCVHCLRAVPEGRAHVQYPAGPVSHVHCISLVSFGAMDRLLASYLRQGFDPYRLARW